MELVLVVFLILVFAYQHPAESRRFHDDYMSKESTQTIQGVFVVLVLFRHFLSYYPCTDAIDKILKVASPYIGQLLVVPFLFFTGYGTMHSIEHKGPSYVRSVLPGKFLKLLLRFDVCVLCFAAFRALLGKYYPLKTILLSLAAWSSVGNSNWYVLAILAFYVIVYLSFRFSGNRYVSVMMATALLFAYTLVLRQFKTAHWYNTVFALSLGMVYYLAKEPIDRLFRRCEACYPVVIALLVLLFVFLKRVGIKRHYLIYEAWSCAFALILVVKSMKLKLKNRFFGFLGGHVFSIYIWQRIPMLFCSHFGFNPPLYGFLGSFAATVVIAVCFDSATAKAEKAIEAFIAKRRGGD